MPLNKNKCPKCGGTGLLPFNKNGKVIPHTFTYCPDCYEEPQERYIPMTPDMWDFPMSTSFRAFTYNYCGQPDSGAVTVATASVREVVIERQPANLQHIRAELNYLHNKVLELKAEKVKQAKQKAKTMGYKGLK